MKSIYKLLFSSILTLSVTACDFDTENYQQIPTENAYQSVQDIQNGMNGAYYAIGSYNFLGNYAVAYGDICADVSRGNASTGHFDYQTNWIIQDTDSEMEGIWNYGFKIIDRCTRTIKGGKEILAKADQLYLSEDDIASAKSYISQCYAMKALANYYLVNLFAYPYQDGINNLGLPLVKDEPIEAFAQIDRSTVGGTYSQITSDIEMAEQYAEESGIEPNEFYMGPMAIQALKARVYMSMGEYETAKTAALEAIELKGKGNGTGDDKEPTDEAYVSMWTSLAISSEDLFTIAKNESDNLSANSLNTLYGSYGATLSNYTISLYGENDIRAQLLGNSRYGVTTTKYNGIPTSAATSNIPVFRKSEMSLIVAEVEARNGQIENAQKYLYYTAKRDKDISSADMLPSTSEELLEFIADERVREFAGEGHRYYDARRMGLKLKLQGFSNPFDVASFVFPIPADEINAGFCKQQNEGWADGLPE